MLEILQFIFSSFWIWLGFTINISIIAYSLAAGVAAIAASRTGNDEKDKLT